MTRKTVDITIDADNRDKGKTYRITEMPASQAERWAFRVFQSLAKSGVEFPDDLSKVGIAGIAVLGFQALGSLDYDTRDALFDEIMACVTYVFDASKPMSTRPLVETDTEEVSTRFRLRAEWFSVQTGFSVIGALANAKAPAETVVS